MPDFLTQKFVIADVCGINFAKLVEPLKSTLMEWDTSPSLKPLELTIPIDVSSKKVAGKTGEKT